VFKAGFQRTLPAAAPTLLVHPAVFSSVIKFAFKHVFNPELTGPPVVNGRLLWIYGLQAWAVAALWAANRGHEVRIHQSP
jgi:hypothetical protein